MSVSVVAPPCNRRDRTHPWRSCGSIAFPSLSNGLRFDPAEDRDQFAVPVRSSARRNLPGSLPRLTTILGVVERFHQPLDPLQIDARHVWMDTRNIYRLLRQKFLSTSSPVSNSCMRSVMPRMWPPSSITLTICFQVRWIFVNSAKDQICNILRFRFRSTRAKPLLLRIIKIGCRGFSKALAESGDESARGIVTHVKRNGCH